MRSREPRAKQMWWTCAKALKPHTDQGDTVTMPHTLRLRALSLTLACAAVLWASGSAGVRAQSTPADDPKLGSWKRTSTCVAVMKREIVGLAEQHKAGKRQVEPDMVRLAEWSFALIGTAYKQGLRKPQADKLLEEAEAALKAQSPDEQQALLQACQSEGQKTYKDANFVERALVSNRAKARVEAMLKPK